jgi:HAD superfamily hydrolase (TIGR01509 family)
MKRATDGGQTMSDVRCEKALFDLDGVVTRTEELHFRAWKEIMEEYLHRKADRDEREPEPFTFQRDYKRYFDGKPRYRGAKTFLLSRDVETPYGEPSDRTDRETVCGISNRKNELFRELAKREGVHVYESTVSLIRNLKGNGLRVGVVSSSRNCRFILEKTGLIDLFDTVIGGEVLMEVNLQGEPHPDMLLFTADNLGIHPERCLLVEDAFYLVEAAKNSHFGLVVGVARNGEELLLKKHGADIVVSDLGELGVEDVHQWFSEGLDEECWHLTYFGFEPGEEKLRESLTTVGNGYFGTRGCFEMERANEAVHYPGTYIAGLYNELPSDVYRRTVHNKDLVNCPNWLLLELRIGDSEYLHPLQEKIMSYEHELDMREGVMTRKLTFEDAEGRVTTLKSQRIASMENHHLGALRFSIVPENYSASITLRSSLDGTVINYGVERYRELNSKHLQPISVSEYEGGIGLLVKTTSSDHHIGMFARNFLYREETSIQGVREVQKDMGLIAEVITFAAEEQVRYTLEKVVAIYTSKDEDLSEGPESSARRALSRIGRFDELFAAHRTKWHELWDMAGCRIEGDRFVQKVIRLHTYHLLVTASPHSKDIDWGMPARGLHGEAYRGHIFWDELFVFPFYNLHFPEISRSFLMYRYRRLDAARTYAAENGYRGAMYPWQSADDGGEETQTWHYNPQSGKWGPDLSRNQRHVSIAIAYDIWAYFYLTGDLEFLHRYGIEMMVEIARFWESAAKYSKQDGRYHIEGVMGPDEFHEKYPDAEEGGLRDNAYTNIMVCWLMHKTVETVEHIPDHVADALSRTIGLKTDEMDRWNDIVRKLNIVMTDEGIISQFDSYLRLRELDWDRYRKRYEDITRLDRILKAEGDTPDRYKVSKQADVLMTYYLLSPGQVRNILEIMGNESVEELKLMEKNYEYYVSRTSHGSTLSKVVHAAILRYLNRNQRDMWEWFIGACRSDIYDTQGGTTAEAIHCGVMGGTLDIIFKGFAGVNVFKDRIECTPFLPAHWHRLSFKMLLRSNLYRLEITQEVIRFSHLKGPGRKMHIRVAGEDFHLENSGIIEIPYSRSP